MQPLKRQEFASRAAEAASTVPDEISRLPSRAQASVLILTTQMMNLAARVWGDAIRDDPRSSPAEMIEAALAALAESRDALFAMTAWTGRSGVVLHQLLATDVCFLTISLPLSPEFLRQTTKCWRTLWPSRMHVPEAISDLRAWEATTKVEGLPRNAYGQPPSDAEVLAESVRVPAFLKKPR